MKSEHDETAGVHSSDQHNLEWAMLALAQLQGQPLDRLQLKAAVSVLPRADLMAHAQALCTMLGLQEPLNMAAIDRAHLPLLARSDVFGWVIVVDKLPNGAWRAVTPLGAFSLDRQDLNKSMLSVSFDKAGRDSDGQPQSESPKTSFTQLMKLTLRGHRPALMEAVIASMFIGALALMTSLFSMQVYDRVIPTRGVFTLLVLGAGVVLSIFIELTLKFVRSRLMESVTIGVDERLSREIFQRLLQVRVDQIPSSVGSLAAQLRGYEQVRSFYTASSLFALVDLPMGVMFLIIIAVIASPLVALVPLTIAILALAIGFFAQRKLNKLAAAGAQYSNLKTGLLVEAVEGVETIKSGSGGWKFLSRWLKLNRNTISNDLSIRRNSESVTYMAAAMHQVGYMGVIVVGALIVMRGDMTTGALIASSILCGRILSPILQVPSLFVQHSHARAAREGLDRLFALKTDNDGIQRVLVPENVNGHYSVQDVKFSYVPQGEPALSVQRLEIKPGERVGIIGPIGSGKSTLLRLLSGMYAPTSGKVLLDGLDLSHISREVINRHIGYLQQEHRLFQGTLRENLLIGLPDPGDEVLLKVMRRTGMDQIVSSHPLGLERPIVEGGKGLSGGQRQLLAFTRLMLTQPEVLLLDEPTANMDQTQEAQCLKVLQEEAESGRSIVIVTHKPTLLPLVERIVVVVGSQILMDGPNQAILQAFAKAEAANLSPTQAPRQGMAPGSGTAGPNLKQGAV